MSTQAGADILFRDVRLFDGERVSARSSVLVRNGYVRAVGADLSGEPDARVVDGAGLTLLPGLIDAHVHAFERSLAQALRFGVTTELDMFADPAKMRVLRQQAAERSDVADIRSAGTGATAPGGHPCQMVGALFAEFPTVASPQQAESFVVDRIAEGSDYLKVFSSSLPGEPDLPQLGADTIRALVRQARSCGLLTVAHATDQQAALMSVRAGVDGLGHLPIDGPLDVGLLETLMRTGAFVIPTLGLLESLCQIRTGIPLLADSRVSALLDVEQTEGLAGMMGPAPAPSYRVQYAKAMVMPMRRAGIPILAGTDSPAPGLAHGASLHRELELLVEAGLSPADALASATSVPADCFGLTDRGRIRPGLRADLLLVAGDPLREITDTRNIVEVYRGAVPLH
ncbi:MAG: amidohydrolase family protein, partial [Pseudonocardiaceae bacterium]